MRWHSHAGVMPYQRVAKFLLHVGNSVEEGALEVEERIADFVEHAWADRSHLVRVPEDLDLGRDPLADAIAFSRGKRRAQPRQLLTDTVLVVEDAAPDRFRGMRGEHRPNFELRQRGRPAVGGDALRLTTRRCSVEPHRLLR